MANRVPDELMKLDNWVAWELRQNPDNPSKPKKIPINPHTGLEAKSNDKATWGSYEQAQNRIITMRNYNPELKGGVGFMFGTSDLLSGIAGFDLDNCFDDDGTLKQYAVDIVRLMNSYTEYSPSGTGLHILFRLSRSLQEIVPSIKTGKKNTSLGIEIYDSGRYFTFTGKVYGDSKPIADRTEQVQEVLAKFFTQTVTQQPKQMQIVHTEQETDAELWEKMFKSKNGDKIRRLYQGDTSGYKNDDSAADMGLCIYLAYATNNDYSRIEQMMSQSALGQRDKWQNRPDYRQRTIEKAINKTSEYLPEMPSQVGGGAGQEPQPEIKFSFNADYLDADFENDMRIFQRYSDRKTGFSNLDERLTLYPALYIIGAISSLGKTTLCLQMADQMAEAGEHVLYFALEQTRFELVSKSLARMCQLGDYFIDTNPTAIQIRQGRTSPELREAMKKYKELAKHEAIIECDFMTDASKITQTVEAYITRYGVKPIVFVDYLQLIRSSNPKLTSTKEIVDENIRALKLLQMRHELVMFVVSSLNRQNYLTTIDFEAFKESGAIEYTADVVMGLQLAVLNTKLFESDAKMTKKRKVVKAAKAEMPRRIELCVLKNRYGVSNESFFFDYYPKFDYFMPANYKVTEEAILKLIKSIPDDDDRKKPI